MLLHIICLYFFTLLDMTNIILIFYNVYNCILFYKYTEMELEKLIFI